MAKLQTLATDKSPREFLKTIKPEDKKRDSFMLLEMFQQVTGEKAVMWGESIVGFGQYHYKSERSTQEGDWLLVGFSPRKQSLTLYIMHGNAENPLLAKLGKFKKSGGCLYLNKLAEVDQTVLRELIKTCFDYMKKTNHVV